MLEDTLNKIRRVVCKSRRRIPRLSQSLRDALLRDLLAFGKTSVELDALIYEHLGFIHSADRRLLRDSFAACGRMPLVRVAIVKIGTNGKWGHVLDQDIEVIEMNRVAMTEVRWRDLENGTSVILGVKDGSLISARFCGSAMTLLEPELDEVSSYIPWACARFQVELSAHTDWNQESQDRRPSFFVS